MEGELSGLNMGLINGLYIMGIIIFIFLWLLFLRSRYAKLVIGKVLCEFITEEGNSYTKLVPVQDGMLCIPPTKKKDGAQYAIADIATYQTDFPAVPRFLSIIQTKAKKAVFLENCWEPLTNRSGKLLLSPKRLYNIVNERFTQLGVEQARDEIERKAASKGFQLKTSHVVYMVIGIVVIALLVFGVYLIKNYQVLSPAGGGG